MPKKLPMFYSALLLTGVNLLLRFVGTGFQVIISRQMGASGVGLLQLVLSVGGLAAVAAIAGIRTSTMYLCAEELGRKRPKALTSVLSGCYVYSIAFSLFVGTALYLSAPWLAKHWIGRQETLDALRLLACFLPVTCLCGVMTGYFTAAGRIGMLSAVEVAEQLCSMTLTLLLLTRWAGQDPAKACLCVVFGSGAGACLTLLTLVALRRRENTVQSTPIPVASRILSTALPLGAADVVKSGITTTENLMVPKRLSLNTSVTDPLALFGTVMGMVFPILMFPACILFALAELLIPELARCAAADSPRRIRYLVRRSLKTALLYGLLFSGLMVLVAEPLCLALYDSPEAGAYLKRYALLIPMLYCDAITDAMTKGLGQQRICVAYNILTSALDVFFLYLLLPRYGMSGYFFSFLVTHLLNFILSLRRLLKISRVHIPLSVPLLALAAGLLAAYGASHYSGLPGRVLSYLLLLGSLLCLFRVTTAEDLHWMAGLIRKKPTA